MNGTPNPNGSFQNRLMWWVMASLVAPSVLAYTASMTHMVVADNARITALERDTEHRLQQIERKIDRLLEER